MLRLLAFLLALSCAAPVIAADLSAVRADALALVNADRARSRLPPLRPDPVLDEAAQRHADDMRARGYFAHQSPDGRNVLDRFLAAGGSGAKRVAENLAECGGCRLGPPLLREFQQGWMDSPGHRANILGQGLDRFGFGLVETRDGVHAVQTFAGPGTGRGAEPAGPALDPPALRAAAVRMINERRRAAGLPPVAESPGLSAAAEEILARLPEGIDGLERIDGRRAIDRALGGRPAWRAVNVVAGECGGCGIRPTASDVAHFRDQWLGDGRHGQALLGPAVTHMGFALAADGEGRKVAIAVLGEH